MKTKRQHYVPRHYLKAWLNKSGMIAVLRKGCSPSYQTLTNTAVVNRLYSLTMPTIEDCSRVARECQNKKFPRQFIQMLFSICYLGAVEQKPADGRSPADAQAISDYLLKEDLLPEGEREELEELLGAGATTERHRASDTQKSVTEGLEPFMTRIEKQFFKTLDVLKRNPKIGSVDSISDVLIYFAVQMFRTPKFLHGKSDKGMADLLVETFDYLTNITQNFNGYLGKVYELGNDSEFITSDNPVIDYSPKLTNASMPPSFYFPISPKLALCLAPRPLVVDDSHARLWVNKLNGLVHEHSDAELYATNTDVLKQFVCPIWA